MREEIRIEVAHGLSESAIRRGRYKPGEGITGQVVQSGKSIIVPKVSEESGFLNRTELRDHASEELSFICVPIKKGQRVVGTLSVDVPYADGRDLRESRRQLDVIATMLAQHVVNLESIRLERESLQRENKRLRARLSSKYGIDSILGNSNKMRDVFQMISQVSRSNATVLIRGESGTGKELVANAIHHSSLRKDKPFVRLNCAALPPDLIESELFGHEKGAFTHALQTKKGKFELAHKGTIFLDEIGSITPDVQYKLLRVLQEKEFERVGGVETIKTDVRIVAATNKHLEDAVQAEEFRGDLYYRLNVFPIFLPPLRERKTDILLLANHFLEKYASENNKDIRRLSSSVIDMMMQYHWPGNVRELENCIERAVILCEDNVIRGYHLPPTLNTKKIRYLPLTRWMPRSRKPVARPWWRYALETTRGNMSKAAQMVKLTERKFTYKVKKHGIDYRRYRSGHEPR